MSQRWTHLWCLCLCPCLLLCLCVEYVYVCVKCLYWCSKNQNIHQFVTPNTGLLLLLEIVREFLFCKSVRHNIFIHIQRGRHHLSQPRFTTSSLNLFSGRSWGHTRTTGMPLTFTLLQTSTRSTPHNSLTTSKNLYRSVYTMSTVVLGRV